MAEGERQNFDTISVPDAQQLPRAWHCAVQLQIMPLLNNADLNAADDKSYRPITNLSIISKLLKWLVAQQLTSYLTDNDLPPDLQSAYHAYHLTETTECRAEGCW